MYFLMAGATSSPGRPTRHRKFWEFAVIVIISGTVFVGTLVAALDEPARHPHHEGHSRQHGLRRRWRPLAVRREACPTAIRLGAPRIVRTVTHARIRPTQYRKVFEL